MATDHEPCDRPGPCGLLLVGHGSRDPAGITEFLATADLVSPLAEPWAVEPCFLEFAEPSIAVGFERLAGRGAGPILVAPVMLFAARHIRQDIPREVATAAARCAGLPVQQAQHLGCHPAIVELSTLRYEEAIARVAPVAGEETALVMVGRGSHDAEATDEMQCFTRLRHAATPVACVRTAFLAMAEPRLEQVLEEVAREGARRIVVQPHLLFAGELLERIRSLVERCARSHPNVQWVVADHLGPSRLVAQAIVERASSLPPAPACPR